MDQDPLRPDWLEDRFRDATARLCTRLGDAPYEELVSAVQALDQWPVFQELIACSDFFVEQVARQHLWLTSALRRGDILKQRQWEADDWDQALSELLPSGCSEAASMSALRTFRHREMLRILWRDHAGLASIEEAFEALSELADSCIRAAVGIASAALEPKYGVPMGEESGEPQSMVVLAMGKLGGNELNFSSDIDLIFAYPEAGSTEGGRQALDNQSYFSRLGQMVIRLLDAVTEDGFAFRVDMRLRPYGDSGALVGSFAALEVYYQEQGREWERYAMIKARPVTGTPVARESLTAMLNSFVYRRYTDFSVIAALRDMKRMMRAEVARLGAKDDLKRGAGGIREIEFIVQSLQLIHGGRMDELRPRSLLAALTELSDAGVLPTQQAARLAQHYRLERRIEHALQAMQDKQTQSLPSEALPRAQLAALSRFDCWETLAAHLTEARREVEALFNDLIADPDGSAQQRAPDKGESTGLTFAAMNATTLAEIGYRSPEDSWSELESLLDSAWVTALQPEGRRRLEAFLPRLCEAAALASHPDQALTRALPFVRAVCRRSAYLALLQENPHALRHLLSLVGSSVWIAERLAARPELVDELLHESTLYSAPSREELRSLVRQQLLRIPEDDLEAQMAALSRIKDAVILRVAASEVSGTLPVMKVSDNLTFLAEVMIEQALAVARAELVKQHGAPQADNAGFAVIGYGKLGGLELSYGSDLDLVFVFDGAGGETAGPRVIDNTRFYTRLAQRVVHVLSAQTYAGRLYEVDLRLRPDGASGLVATTLPALRRYQLESAWIWEHQALVRTRVVAGDAELTSSLEALRSEVLSMPRDNNVLASAVREMREKMRAEHAAAPGKMAGFDLKRDPGGIVDIEFVVQYLVLAHASEHDALSQWSDVVRLLEALANADLISNEDAATLTDAYLIYRGHIHQLALQGGGAIETTGSCDAVRERVKHVTETLLPGLQTG